MVYYVYIHKKKDTDQIFYVGKGHGRRAWESIGRSYYWNNVVSKHGFVVEFLKEGLSELEAYALEKQAIKEYGRFQKGGFLVNLTDGGEGRCGFSWNGQRSGNNNPMNGHTQSENTKKLISQSKIGKPRPQKVKDALRLANLNRPKELHGMYGKQHTKETKQKMSLAGRGKPKPRAVILNYETGIYYRGWLEVAQCLGINVGQLEYLRKKNNLNKYIKV